MSKSADKATQPSSIEVLDDALRITWGDGKICVYPHRFLREKCPCALCAGEPGLLASSIAVQKPQVPANIKPERFSQVGRYALGIYWSDNHSTGIYSFKYLRDLCRSVSEK